MKGTGSPVRKRTSRGRWRRAVLAAAGGTTVVLTLAACSGLGAGTADPRDGLGSPTAGSQGPSTTPAQGAPQATPTPITSAPAPAAVITAAPNSAESAIDPTDPVTVSIDGGTLTSVRLLTPEGKEVHGRMAADRSSWHSTEVLGYDRSYDLVATGQNADGLAVTKHATVTTVAPSNYTMPSITDIYGHDLQNHGVYGVGMVVRVHFDEQVNHKLAQRTLSVTTDPSVVGGWYWRDNQNVFWRPRHWYPSGTTVTVTAGVYGKRVGPGLYGQADRSTSFRIGAKHVSIANPRTDHVKVYFDGKFQRSMPTSMGMGGYEPGNSSINYWTMWGTYTVINHENPAMMSAGSYGVSPSSPNYYPPEAVYWSTKISTDGIYLHQLDTTVWAQGHENLSHGCLNLNLTNARWFYNHSKVGDIVKVVHSQKQAPKIDFDQGGQWSIPWSQWVKGSALS